MSRLLRSKDPNGSRDRLLPLSRQSGTSLIEVMVSVAVSSVGLLGIAALTATSAKSNHGALEHTLAGLAAQTLTESMHINPQAVRLGLYDGYYAADAKASGANCRNVPCSASDAANYDRARFGQLLNASLPSSRAQLQCDSAPAASASEVACRLRIEWAQRGLQANETTLPQTLVWVFSP